MVVARVRIEETTNKKIIEIQSLLKPELGESIHGITLK